MDNSMLTRFAKQYGTPLYVLDQQVLENSLSEIQRAFSRFPGEVQIAYPYKANPLKRLCQHLLDRGLWAEVSSGLELEMAIQLGVDPGHIMFNSPFKSDRDLEMALRIGCKLNIDNRDEFDRLTSIIRHHGINGARVGVRIGPTSGTYWDKFGFQLGHEALSALEDMSRASDIQLIGLHIHRSSLASLEEYREHISGFLRFASDARRYDLIKLDYIDIGSGFAVEFPTPVESLCWTVPSMEDYANIVASTWRDLGIPKECRLIVEPGRRLVAPAVTLLTRVVSVKSRPSGRVVIVDIGQNLLPGIDIYRYPILQTKQRETRMSQAQYAIHGCLCDSLDIIAPDVDLFSVEVGEILAIESVGGYDMSRSFVWQIPRAPVLWVRPDGECELVRRPENAEDIWRLSA